MSFAHGYKWIREESVMQQYQFERIYSFMEKEFGKIKSGQEQQHEQMLFPMESNLLKVYRSDPASNSRRLKEAIALALFDIRSKYSGEEFALDKFRNKDNEKLEYALLMTFDPFTNEKIKESLASVSELDLTDVTQLHDFYAEAVICMLRIKESIDLWEKKMGSNGYFQVLENMIGAVIKGNEMQFVIVTLNKQRSR